MNSQLQCHPVPHFCQMYYMLPLFISLLTEAFTTLLNNVVSSLYLKRLSLKSPCYSHSVVISGSFLVDHESSKDYILKKSTPLMAQSMLVAPFMNRKGFVLFLSLESHYYLLDIFNLISGLLERPLRDHNTMTLIVLLIKSPDIPREKSTVKLVAALQF